MTGATATVNPYNSTSIGFAASVTYTVVATDGDPNNSRSTTTANENEIKTSVYIKVPGPTSFFVATPTVIC